MLFRWYFVLKHFGTLLDELLHLKIHTKGLAGRSFGVLGVLGQCTERLPPLYEFAGRLNKDSKTDIVQHSDGIGQFGDRSVNELHNHWLVVSENTQCHAVLIPQSNFVTTFVVTIVITVTVKPDGELANKVSLRGSEYVGFKFAFVDRLGVGSYDRFQMNYNLKISTRYLLSPQGDPGFRESGP
ncbi:hypothetical protein OG21DRAFT_1526403 [Imleria badia]|nr:hypothetical protein OG21DRAFT_1526403 [Imleria badia]